MDDISLKLADPCSILQFQSKKLIQFPDTQEAMIYELIFTHLKLRCANHHEDLHTHDYVHDPGVSSISIVCEGNLELEKANIWLGTLLLERSEDIYHMKSLLSVQGMKERFVFQGLGALKMPTLIFLHHVYMATQAFQLAQGNTSFKEKPEIMLSSAILKLSD